MYIDKGKMLSFAYDISLNQTKFKTNQEAMKELATIMGLLNNQLENSELEKTCNWILLKNLWLQNENGKLNSFYNYSRGDIIRSLDLGTSNIGTEIRYPHPCVVLYDNNEDWVVVAPITAASTDAKGNSIYHPPFEIFIPRQVKKPKDPKEFYFAKDSVIQVDQIRRVSKFRAVNKIRFKLRTDLLNQIDNILLEHFVPLKYKLLNKMIDVSKKQVEEINQLRIENEELLKDNEKLNSILKDLQEKLDKLKPENLAG